MEDATTQTEQVEIILKEEESMGNNVYWKNQRYETNKNQ